MLHTVKIFWTFYRSFILLPALITVCCLGLFLEYGFSIFAALFWLKIATLAVTYYFTNYYKRQEYYYYYNLGISKRKLWTLLVIIDLLVFVLLITFIHHYQ